MGAAAKTHVWRVGSTAGCSEEHNLQLAAKTGRETQGNYDRNCHSALESELHRDAEKEPLADRIARIAADLAAEAGPNWCVPSKSDIDAMWAHD